MDSMVEQVLIVCPDASADDVRLDLRLTLSPQETINRIFDGNVIFLIGVSGADPHPAASEDLDDLPVISIATKTRFPHPSTIVPSTTDDNQPAHSTDSSTDLINRVGGASPISVTSRHGDSDGDEGRTLTEHGRVNQNVSYHIDISSSDGEDDVRNRMNHKHVKNTRLPPRPDPESDSSDDGDDYVQLGLLQRLKTQTTSGLSAQREIVKSALFGSTSMCSSTGPDHVISDSDDDPMDVVHSTHSEVTSSSQTTGYSSSLPYSMETDSLGSQTVTSQDSSSSSASNNKRQKRTPVEIEAAKKLATQRKMERDHQRQEKARQLEEKRQQKQREVDQRKAVREAKRAEKPGECIKYMTVLLDNHVLEESSGAQVLARLQTLGCKYAIETQPVPSCIRWRRSQEHGEGMDNKLEPQAIVFLSPGEFVEMVHAYKCEQRGVWSTATLPYFVKEVTKQLGGIVPTVAILGMEKYFRSKKNSHQREFRNAVLGAAGGEEAGKGKKRKRKPEDIETVVSRVEVEEALVNIQIKLNCNVRFLETADQMADLVAMFTKAVAETPFKRRRDEAKFAFHVSVDWAGGVKVAKDGAGLQRVWRQQFQQFRNVSPEIASAIVAQYPSPQLLLQAYRDCVSEEAGKKLIQDVVVRRGEGVLATTRRVGPELSRRVYNFFHSSNGDLVL